MSKRGRLAQAATEYLIIVGFTLAILSVLLALYYSTPVQQNYNLCDSQVRIIGNKISSAVDEVYYLGEPSRKSLDIYMPQGVEDIRFISDKAIVFYIGSGSDTSQQEFPISIEVVGNLTPVQGKKQVMILAKTGKVCIMEKGMNESQVCS